MKPVESGAADLRVLIYMLQDMDCFFLKHIFIEGFRSHGMLSRCDDDDLMALLACHPARASRYSRNLQHVAVAVRVFYILTLNNPICKHKMVAHAQFDLHSS